MLTVSDLKKRAKEREDLANRTQIALQKEYEAQCARRCSADVRRAKDIVENPTALEAIICSLDEEGFKQLRLSCDYCYRYKNQQWDNIPTKFQLGFEPIPNTEATEILRDMFFKAGYVANTFEEWVQNTDWEFYGDGNYRVVEAPGRHKVYYLIVNWR